jgi:CheY-like chemotaxis protein/anti-sigma regulatory factor (Ser/Thr protein kinase)
VQPVDLLGIVLAAIDVIMPSATAKRIRIRTSLDPKTPRVMGDPDRLQQCVWNLLSNALKFTDAGGTIEVRLEVGETSARIVVSDTGQGISAEFLPQVFDRFRQNDASSARRHGGLGLGLALAREIVELHGGTVHAASDGEGRGSTFTIELPTAMSPQPRGMHSNVVRLEAAPSLAGVRVVVVEDESDARDLVVTALEQRGAQVMPYSSSADAVDGVSQAADGALPHVVVSDIGMPGEDGYELIRRIRALPPERGGSIPAIAVTGYAARDDVARALAAGYQLHVSKPIDPRSLVIVIAKLAGVS